MELKITVTGPTGQLIEHHTNVEKTGDLAQATSEAFVIYNKKYPDAPPFQKTLKVEHA